VATAGPRILVVSSHKQALVRSVDALCEDLVTAEVQAVSGIGGGAAAVDTFRPHIVFLLARSESLEACLEFCRWLRSDATQESPALVLVYPSKQVDDWKRLYDAQGDMFISWDGDFIAGLASCARSLLGRRYRMVSVPLEAGALQLFPEGLLARIGGHLVALTPHEFRVAQYLVENAMRIVSRDELADALAGIPRRNCRRINFKGLVYQTISTLRAKLYPNQDIILNVYGKGYRLDLTYAPA